MAICTQEQKIIQHFFHSKVQGCSYTYSLKIDERDKQTETENKVSEMDRH